MPERLSMGGWYPPDHGLSAPDLYAAWLHQHGYEDSPQRRAEFAAETGVTLPEEDYLEGEQ